MPDVNEIERELQILEVELRKLEGEYNMYFAGRLPRPPWETRSRVEGLVKKLDRSYIQNYGDRFRFSTLQSRFAAFIDLWDRGLRAREEGRPGPFSRKPAATACNNAWESGRISRPTTTGPAFGNQSAKARPTACANSAVNSLPTLPRIS